MPSVGKKLSNSLQSLITNSSLGIRLALALGRYIPPRLGYPMARSLADFISERKDWGMVRGARVNQWVVRGQRSSANELDRAVQDTLRFQARSLYELYRYLARPEMMAGRLIIAPEVEELIGYSHSPVPGLGKIVVGIHLSNFDFALHALFRYGIRALALTVGNLAGGYQRQFDLRTRSGLEYAPASVSSFRLAIERLKAGGVVLTGIDRPLENPKHRPMFFGHPAPLPVHHIHLALKAKVPVVLMAVRTDPNGIYRILVSGPIYMVSDPDRIKEIVKNAEIVLSVAEQFIRQAPEQWAMFFPVWSDLIETLP